MQTQLINLLLTTSISPQLCSFKSRCDKANPCCSEFGYCGKSIEFCGGGCINQASHISNSCHPLPRCLSGLYTFQKGNMKKTVDYDGNSDQTDFTFNGYPLVSNRVLYLRMYKGENMGTRVSTTRYVLFGRIECQMKTSVGKGVVSSFITMSDTKDEIDFEFVGSRTGLAEANYYSHGVKDHTNGGAISIPRNGDSYLQWHTYTIDWSPKAITWLIDGVPLRTVRRGEKGYPDTPSRVQFGIWNGGDGPQGTRVWSGGYVDWELRDPKELGYYYAAVKDLKIDCYDEPSMNNRVENDFKSHDRAMDEQPDAEPMLE